MQRQIIITDLTRFTGDQTVCTAGIDYNTMECIRPLPFAHDGAHTLAPAAGGFLVGSDGWCFH